MTNNRNPSTQSGSSPVKEDSRHTRKNERKAVDDTRVVQLLEQIAINQERILSFLNDRDHPEHRLSQNALSLWNSRHHAWSASSLDLEHALEEIDEDDTEEADEESTSTSLGYSFLSSVAPCGESLISSIDPVAGHERRNNISLARDEFVSWLKRTRSERWYEAHFTTFGAAAEGGLSSINQWWPRTWRVSRFWNRPCCSWQEVSYAFPRSFRDPFHYVMVPHGAVQVAPPITTFRLDPLLV